MYRKLVSGVLFAFVLLSIIVSCSSPEPTPTPTDIPSTSTPAPSPTPTPVPVPTIAGNEWDMLTFGDSRTALATWSEMYAEFIKEDLGVDVQIRDRAERGEVSERLLERIQNFETLREEIRDAEIITILTTDSAGYDIFVYNLFSGGCRTEEFERILEEFISEIYSLREGNPTIMRLLEHYNFTGVSKAHLEYFDIRKDCAEEYNAVTRSIAEEYRILVVPIYATFNGSTGEENPDDKGYLSDGMHLSTEGDAVVADLLRDLGYDPILP